MKFFNFFKISTKPTKDVAIDLGTANTVVYVKGEGIQIDEPTYVALNIKTEEVEYIGEKAKEIIGRTAKHTEIIRPLKNGVISDYEITEKMLTEFLRRIKKDKVQSARVIICVPSGVTQVERRAVVEVVKDAGAKEVYLIEEPVAAAIGAGIDLFQPKGHLIVDIGGGTTEIAVFKDNIIRHTCVIPYGGGIITEDIKEGCSIIEKHAEHLSAWKDKEVVTTEIAFIVSGGAAVSKSVKIAGDHLNEDIMEYIKEKHNLLIGERTAEELKVNTISMPDKKASFEIRGRELGIGLPKSIKIVAEEIDAAIDKNIDLIIDDIKLTMEEIEPEVAADIYETGIYLSGGGAGIRILKEKIEKELKLKVTVSDEAIHAVVNGIAVVLDDFEKYKNIIISPSMEY